MSYTPPPAKWSKKQRYHQIPEDATSEQIEQLQELNKKIAFENSICCDKKAYFFGYVYPKKMTEYRTHKKVCDRESKIKFGIGVNDLIKIVDKSPEQKKFLKDYYRYSPLFNSRCTMNILAKYIEDVDFRYKYNKERRVFDYHCFMTCNESELDKKVINKFNKLLNKYTRLNKDIIVNISTSSVYLDEEEYNEVKTNMFDGLYADFFNDCMSVINNTEQCVNYLIYVCYKLDATCQKSLVWYCFGDDIANNVKKNSNHRYKVVENPNGKEFFGKKFTIVDNYEVNDAI